VPSHFGCLGIAAEDQAAFEAVARQASEAAESHRSKRGTYLRWSCESGAEMWLQVNSRQELVGVQPHYDGDSRMQVGVAHAVARPGDSELDGAFYCWANPGEKVVNDGDYPRVFDAPDFHLHAPHLAYPSRCHVQLVAFAEELEVFPSLPAYSEAQGDEPRMASQSFVPAGLFASHGGQTTPPTAHALLTGEVLVSAEKRNSLTGLPFYWVRAQTYGATIDVVVETAPVVGLPPPGSVIQGTFWLSGRLSGYPARRGMRLISRLFGE